MNSYHICDDDCRSNGCSHRFETGEIDEFIELCKISNPAEMHPCLVCGQPIPPEFEQCPESICGQE